MNLAKRNNWEKLLCAIYFRISDYREILGVLESSSARPLCSGSSAPGRMPGSLPNGAGLMPRAPLGQTRLGPQAFIGVCQERLRVFGLGPVYPVLGALAVFRSPETSQSQQLRPPNSKGPFPLPRPPSGPEGEGASGRVAALGIPNSGCPEEAAGCQLSQKERRVFHPRGQPPPPPGFQASSSPSPGHHLTGWWDGLRCCSVVSVSVSGWVVGLFWSPPPAW